MTLKSLGALEAAEDHGLLTHAEADRLALLRGERFIASLPAGAVVEVRTVAPRDKRTPGTACYVAFEIKRPSPAKP